MRRRRASPLQRGSDLRRRLIIHLPTHRSGRFDDLNEASRHKTNVQANGIPDAFVSAYYQGQRISIARAQSIVPEEAVDQEPEPVEVRYVLRPDPEQGREN